MSIRTVVVLCLCLTVCCTLPLRAQPDTKFCATDSMAQYRFRTTPALRQQHGQMNDLLYRAIMNSRSGGAKQDGSTLLESYTIPVVVHIVHLNGAENISDEQVRAGIQHLNDAFHNEGAFHREDGVSIGLSFCLARQDASGRPTTGITRTASPLSNHVMEEADTDLKAVQRWDPSQYLNIWLVREITSVSMGAAVAGYAFFPEAHGSEVDGIVVEARWFGSSPATSSVHIHEAGHYLGLYHTFQGGCTNNDCLGDGDRICDTPPDGSTAAIPCDVAVNSCSSDEDDHSTNNPFRAVSEGGRGDQNDLHVNHMDYGMLECGQMFTAGQRERMLFVLYHIRWTLLSSRGCMEPCTTPVATKITVAPATTVNVDVPVSFSSATSGATAYEWFIDGVLFSTDVSPGHTFTETGSYLITLVAGNETPGCTARDSVRITVVCPLTVSFHTDRTTIAPGETVNFTNTSTGATSYQWLIDGTVHSTGTDFSFTFNDPGGYLVELAGYNGRCYDTSYSTFVRVGSCFHSEALRWYFGYNAALDFTTSPPTQIPNSALRADEGVASICDAAGNLLFYTDGRTIYRNDNSVMPGATGLPGHTSTTQAALIVPVPESTGRYYVFSLDQLGGAGGLTYSIVDMALDNGKGGLETKLVPLMETATEKLTAVPHCNNRDIWLLAHNWPGNEFYSFLITPSGIGEPVISTTGTVHTGGINGTWNSAGYMRVSPDGTQVAVAIRDVPAYELFDFDRRTGRFSNPLRLDLPGGSSAYGVEFSPDGSKLYGNVIYPGTIYQYDLEAGSPEAIAASVTAVGTTGSRQFGSIQAGPDGKIYAARAEAANGGGAYLGIIHNPNARGTACRYEDNGIRLVHGKSGFGLQNLMQIYITPPPPPAISGPVSVCAPSVVAYTLEGAGCNTDNVFWTLQGKAKPVQITSDRIDIAFESPGTDTLIVLRSGLCNTGGDTLVIESHLPPVVDLLKDTSLCEGTPLLLDAGDGYASYLWHNGATTRTVTAATPGTYWVQVTGADGCIAADTITVYGRDAVPPVSLGDDRSMCSGSVFVLDAGEGYSDYRWQDRSTGRTYTVYTPGIYRVTVTDHCGTVSSDTIIISTDPPLALSVDTTVCRGETVQLSAAEGALSYRWSPEEGLDDPTSRTPAATPGKTTVYTVTATYDNGCIQQGTVTVTLADNIGSFRLSIPDTLGITGTEDFVLPVRITVPTALLPLVLDSLRFTVAYNPRLFDLTSVRGPAVITSLRTFDKVSLLLRNISLTQSQTVVAELSGMVLLGEIDSDVVTLDDVHTSGCLQPVVQNGSLGLDPNGTCAFPIRRIQLMGSAFSLPDVVISPNPADHTAGIDIATSEEGGHAVSVYNLQGRLVWKEYFVHSGDRSVHSLPIPTDRLGTGLYQVVLTTPSQAVTRILSVIR